MRERNVVEEYEIDYSDINSIMNEIFDDGKSFEDYIGMNISFQDISTYIFDTIKGEGASLVQLISKIIIIVVIAAIFINLSKTIKGIQVSETGFYVAYMLLFIILSVLFTELFNYCSNKLNTLIEFMQALIPTFFLTVTYASGSVVAISFYQSFLIVVGIIDTVLLEIFLPAVNIYFVLAMLNPIMYEDMFSKCVEFVEKLIVWGLKGISFIMCSLSVIQGMIIPAAGNVRKSIVGKGISMIPGVGNSIGQMYESVYGAGMLIKNSVGTAGLIIIIIICLVPVTRLILYSLVIQTTAVCAQPVSGDTRMTDGISAAGTACRLLFYIIFTAAVMFVITMAVVIIATGVGV